MEKDKEVMKPKYAWVIEEGVDEVTPVRRKISKTMEITENFTFYDALAYKMKMEKRVEDLKGEIMGLESMIKAYDEELEVIEEQLGVEEFEKQYNLELHEKLKKEEEEKGDVVEEVIESPYAEKENND